MFDKELMKQLATIPAESRAEWIAERKNLEALAGEMTRLNVEEMIPKYGIARVLRVLAATIKQSPMEYDSDVVTMAIGFLPSGLAETRSCGSAQPSTGHTSRTCFASMRTSGSYEKGA